MFQSQVLDCNCICFGVCSEFDILFGVFRQQAACIFLYSIYIGQFFDDDQYPSAIISASEVAAVPAEIVTDK